MNGNAWFTTTHWSVVLAAKQSDGAQADAAMERLCQTYWPPLYAFIRRDGYSPEDAQDLTQEFLSRLVHKEWLNHLHDQRGKFRSFLLTFLKHFLSDQRARAHAQKRGGGRTFVSLEAFVAEERAELGTNDALTPDQIYERRWAQTVLAGAVRRLDEDYRRRGQGALFEHLKDLQPGEHGERSYAQIGFALGMTEQAIKNAVHAFRRRYGEMLREEIAQTVVDAAQAREELAHLMALFAS